MLTSKDLPILSGPGFDYIFSIYDCARKAYTAPFLATTLEQAKRFCVDQINVSPTSYFALYPNSFLLHCIGSFNHDDSRIESYSPYRIGTFAEIQNDVKESSKDA